MTCFVVLKAAAEDILHGEGQASNKHYQAVCFMHRLPRSVNNSRPLHLGSSVNVCDALNHRSSSTATKSTTIFGQRLALKSVRWF